MLEEGPKPRTWTCYEQAEWFWAKARSKVGDWIVITRASAGSASLEGMAWVRVSMSPNDFQAPFEVRRASKRHGWQRC